jgi:hypothetical protein
VRTIARRWRFTWLRRSRKLGSTRVADTTAAHPRIRERERQKENRAEEKF